MVKALNRVELLEKFLKDNIINKNSLENKEKLIKFLKNRLTFIPSKLYKYRTCEEHNIKTFDTDTIWMAAPEKCDDPLDFTLNYDLANQKNNIISFIRKNLDELILFFLNDFLLAKFGFKHKIFTKEMIVDFKNNCCDENYEISEERFIDYALKNTDESVAAIFIAVNQIKKYLENNDDAIRFAEAIIEEANSINTITRNSSLIYCLAEDNTNNYMWEYYADKYQGFCIEFSFDNFEEYSIDSYKNLVYLYPIIYEEKEEFNIFEFLNDIFKEHIFKIEKNNIFTGEDRIDLNKQIMTKKKEWESQKEWRMIIKNKSNNKQPFPYAKAIYLGKDISAENKNTLIDMATKKRIKIYQQKFNASKSNYIFEELK